MRRVAIDSNILIYAEVEPDSSKGMRSADLILRAAQNGVMPAQVLGEFLRFARRRFLASLAEPTRHALVRRPDGIINKAAGLPRAHRLQLRDCVVCAASAEAGAKVLLTEDTQDGRILDGLYLMTPSSRGTPNLSAIYWPDKRLDCRLNKPGGSFGRRRRPRWRRLPPC